MSLLDRLNKFPPFLCRLVARTADGRKMLSRREIARRSGLSRTHVLWLSRLPRWNGVPMQTVDRYSGGCGVNLLATRRHVDWLKRRKKSAWRGREEMVRQIFAASKV